MRIRSKLIALVLAGALSFALIDPLGFASGRYDSNPYSEISGELNKPSTVGVLVLASYADFYKFPVYTLSPRCFQVPDWPITAKLRWSMGTTKFCPRHRWVKKLLRYLNSKNISHLIIPMATVETGVVFHRWSTHGTVNLDLSSQSFSLVKQSGGNYPLALYKVNFENESVISEAPPSYTLEWSGVRPEFYSLLRIIDDGYKVKYLRRYEERIDTAWVFEGEQAKLTFNSVDKQNQEFIVELQFTAAYGDNAPPQVLRLLRGGEVVVISLKAGEVSTATFALIDHESIEIKNVLPCRQGISFEPNDQDGRKFCYGLRDVIVRATN